MNTLEPSAIMASLLRQFLFDTSCDRHTAMYFQVNTSMDNYGYEKDGNTCHSEWRRRYHATTHIFVTKNYNVFTGIGNQRNLKAVGFKNVSNHDSAWQEAMRTACRDAYQQAINHCFTWMKDDPIAKEHAPKTWYDTLGSAHVTLGQGMFQDKVVQFAHLKIGDYVDGQNYLRHLNEWDFIDGPLVTAPIVPEKSGL